MSVHDVNPAKLEPRAFAQLVKRSSADELRQLISGQQRHEVLDTIFDRMPGVFRADRAGTTTAVLHWKVGDRPGGGADTVAFVGRPRIPNRDYVLSFETPEFKHFSANAFLLWGNDENFFEWSPGRIIIHNAGLTWRPTDKVRLDGTYALEPAPPLSELATVLLHPDRELPPACGSLLVSEALHDVQAPSQLADALGRASVNARSRVRARHPGHEDREHHDHHRDGGQGQERASGNSHRAGRSCGSPPGPC